MFMPYIKFKCPKCGVINIIRVFIPDNSSFTLPKPNFPDGMTCNVCNEQFIFSAGKYETIGDELFYLGP